MVLDQTAYTTASVLAIYTRTLVPECRSAGIECIQQHYIHKRSMPYIMLR